METQGIDDKMLVETQLLTSNEKAICERIVALEETPHSHRASMLLALDAGETQTQSALQAGMTLGSLKYWLKKFRSSRMAIFPEVLQDSFELEIEAPSEAIDSETGPLLKTKKVKKAVKKPEEKAEKKKKPKKTKEKKQKDSKKKNKKDKAGKKQKKSKKDKKKAKNKKSKK